VKDLAGRVPPWGYTESVLIDGDKLICTPGSETKGTFAALDKKTGQLLWQSGEITARAEYGSPILIEFDGVRQVITMSRAGLVAVSPEDGKFLWQYNRMAKIAMAESNTAHGNSAAYADGYVFEATSYQTRGGCAVRLKSKGTRLILRTLGSPPVRRVRGFLMRRLDHSNLLCFGHFRFYGPI